MILKIFNGPAPTPTTMQAKQATGTSIITMLQVKTGATNKAKILEWGVSFDGSTANTPVQCELLETGSVFATITATVLADITNLSDPGGPDPTISNVVVGTTTATGYLATAEGSWTTARVFDSQQVPPTGQWVYQPAPGKEWIVNVGTCLRLRMLASVAVNATCYVILEV